MKPDPRVVISADSINSLQYIYNSYFVNVISIMFTDEAINKIETSRKLGPKQFMNAIILKIVYPECCGTNIEQNTNL